MTCDNTIYTPPKKKGDEKNIQVCTKRNLVVNTPSYADSDTFSITVEKTGTYKVTWVQIRTNTNSNNRGILRINGEQYGKEQYTYTLEQYAGQQSIDHVPLSEGDVVKVAIKCNTSNQTIYATTLVIEEE